MADVQVPGLDAPAYEEYRKATERINQQLQAVTDNKEELRKFLGDVELWKSNARHAETALAKEFGYVLPPRPTPPNEKIFNEKKFNDFWTRRHHNGEELPDHYFFDLKRMEFPESLWQLRPPTKPAPVNTGRPVGKKDPTYGKGWYFHIDGSVKPDGKPYVDGDTWTDEFDIDYTLHEFEGNPFNPATPLRWAAPGAKLPS